MITVEYEYYTDTYLGSQITADEWPMVSARAAEYIDYITYGRAADDESDAVKKAVCAVADRYQLIEQARYKATQGEKASETVGPWSVTYRSGEEIAAAYGREMYTIAARYLLTTGYLYRGGRRCI